MNRDERKYGQERCADQPATLSVVLGRHIDCIVGCNQQNSPKEAKEQQHISQVLCLPTYSKCLPGA